MCARLVPLPTINTLHHVFHPTKLINTLRITYGCATRTVVVGSLFGFWRALPADALVGPPLGATRNTVDVYQDVAQALILNRPLTLLHFLISRVPRIIKQLMGQLKLPINPRNWLLAKHFLAVCVRNPCISFRACHHCQVKPGSPPLCSHCILNTGIAS